MARILGALVCLGHLGGPGWDCGPAVASAAQADSTAGGFVLQASTPGGGMVMVSPSLAVYPSNALVVVSVVPEAGWQFLGWLGDLEGSALTNTVQMDRDKCLEAVFGTHLLLDIEGQGTALRQPDLEYYPYGKVCRITALPNMGYRFGTWFGAGSGDANPIEFTVTNANPILSIQFSILPGGEAALTVPLQGQGGVSVLPYEANAYPLGQFVQLDPIPAPGQQFVGWGGDASGTHRPLDILIDGNKVVTAIFTSIPRMSVGPCSGRMLEDGFRLSLEGPLGGVFQVDRSGDLSGWTPLITLTNELGKVLWTDRTITDVDQRYYRALSIP